MLRVTGRAGRSARIVWLLSGLFAAAGGDCSAAGHRAHPALPVLLAQAAPSASPTQSVEANIASLHQRLQITPAQEAQFNAVANVMRENARAGASAPQGPPASATAVDDLRAYIRYGEVELAGLKRLLPALEALYAALSPAQRQSANAAFRQGPGG